MKKKDIVLIILAICTGILFIKSINLTSENKELKSKVDSLYNITNNLQNNISALSNRNIASHSLTEYNYTIVDGKLSVNATINSPRKPTKVAIKYKEVSSKNWNEVNMTTTDYPKYNANINFNPDKDYNISLYFVESNTEYPFSMDNFSYKALAKSHINYSSNLHLKPNNNELGVQLYFSNDRLEGNIEVFNINELNYKVFYDGKVIKEFNTNDFTVTNNGINNTFVLNSTVPVETLKKDFDNSLLKGEFHFKDFSGNKFVGISSSEDLEIISPK